MNINEKTTWVATCLLGATLLAYVPALGAGFIWDDNVHVLDKPNFRGLAGLQRIWLEPSTVQEYYPVLHTSFWLESRLFGLEPFGYHLVNVLLHAANALLVWLVLRRLQVPGALFAGAIFALHPVHVESVAWITEQKNTLSGLFYLAALLAYLRFRPIYPLTPTGSVPAGPPRNRRLGYVLSLVAFVLALLSKTVTCSLPAVIVLLLWSEHGRVRKDDLSPLVPMFVLGAGLAATTVWVEKVLLGAHGAPWDFSWVERCLIAGRALWFYAAKLCWPFDLMFIYPRWQVDPSVWWQYAYPLGALAVVIALTAIRGRVGRSPVVAVLVFAGTLTPALGFFDVYFFVYSFVADHFQYLATVGLIALAAAVVTHLVRKSRLAQAGPVAAAVVLALLGALTWEQSQVYRDNETLWRDTLRKNPDAAMAHTNLANLLSGRGEVAAAMPHYVKASELVPDADYEANLAGALQRLGRKEEALRHYARAVEINPRHSHSHHYWGCLLLDGGRLDEAIEHFARTVEIQPDAAKAHYHWAIALDRLNRPAEALEHYSEALRLHYAAVAAQRMITTDSASDVLRVVDAARTHFFLGNALRRTSRLDEAVEQYRAAVRLDPRFSAAQDAVAQVQAQRSASTN